MANKNERKKVKVGATRILCGILAGLMVIGSVATIIVSLINC
jgi:hypothetical protein